VVNAVSGPSDFERQLLESQSTLLSLLDLSPDAVIAHRDNEIFFCNRAAVDMFGLSSRDGLIGTDATELLHADERTAVARRRVEAEKRGRMAFTKRHFVRQDGGDFYAEVSGTALKDQGRTTFMVIIRDISERLRTEEALRESEAKLRAIMESAGDAILVNDSSGRFVEVNEEACRSLGYARAELLEKYVHDVEVALTREEIEQNFDAISQDVTMTVESVHRRKDGTEFPVEVRGTLIVMGGEKFSLSVARDITQRKRMENALRTSEEQYRRFFEDAGIGMAIVETDGRFREVNDAFAQMLGYDTGELSKLGIADISHPDDLETGNQYWNELLAGQRRSYQLEKRYRRKDGRYVWGLLTTAAAYDGKGQITHAISQIVEITAKKAPSTARNDVARSSGDPRDAEYLREVTHRMRTHINAVIGFSEALDHEIFGPFQDERQRQYIRDIQGAGEKLAIDVNDILQQRYQTKDSGEVGEDKKGDAQNIVEANLDKEPEITNKPDGQATRIVAIDDEIPLLHWINDALTHFGYDVVTCHYSGPESTAFKSLLDREDWAPDVVISDYHLPGSLDGMGIADRLRTTFGADIPVLLFTGDNNPDLIAAAKEKGFQVLLKPVRINDLRQAIETAAKETG